MSRGLQCMKQGVRIVFMGSARVGKTSIIRRFLHKKFQTDYRETIEDMYRTSFRNCQMDILDTTGYYHFPVMRDYAISTGDVFVLVFAWDDNATFEYLHTLLDKIREMKESKAKVIVVANKMDVEHTVTRLAETEMVVSIDWDCLFHQCSAKSDTNVTELLDKIVDVIKENKEPVKVKTGSIKKIFRRFKKRAFFSTSDSSPTSQPCDH